MRAARPWRQCPSCRARCHWVEPTWVCDRCRGEFTQADDPKFAPPGGMTVDLATCSYGEFRPAMGVGVRTSLGTPRWIKREGPWPYVPEITPRRSYLNAPQTEFIDAYFNQLRAVGVARIREQFRVIAQQQKADRLVLLCFEKLTGGWCHRRLFASWWYTATGQAVPELGEVPVSEQLTLDLEGAES